MATVPVTVGEAVGEADGVGPSSSAASPESYTPPSASTCVADVPSTSARSAATAASVPGAAARAASARSSASSTPVRRASSAASGTGSVGAAVSQRSPQPDRSSTAPAAASPASARARRRRPGPSPGVRTSRDGPAERLDRAERGAATGRRAVVDIASDPPTAGPPGGVRPRAPPPVSTLVAARGPAARRSTRRTRQPHSVDVPGGRVRAARPHPAEDRHRRSTCPRPPVRSASGRPSSRW